MIILLTLILLSLLITNFWLIVIFGWLYNIYNIEQKREQKRKVERLYG
jgi:hypothetical protein